MRVIPRDEQTTFHSGGARLVNATDSSHASMTSTQTGTAGPTELANINEPSSSRTSLDTHTPKKRYGPVLRVSSAAEMSIMGQRSRSVSFSEPLETHQSGNVFYPRTLRGNTPPDDDQDDEVTSEKAMPPQSPVESIRHKVPRKPVRIPPRTSSLNALANFAASQADSAGEPVAPPKLKLKTISIDGLVKRFPEVDGAVIQSNVVRAPEPPRMARVMDGLRNAFSRGRTERRATSFEILGKAKSKSKAEKPSIPHPVRSPVAPAVPAAPAATTTTDEGSLVEKLRRQTPRPASRTRRPTMMSSLDQVRLTLNALGRELVDCESRERRRELLGVSWLSPSSQS